MKKVTVTTTTAQNKTMKNGILKEVTNYWLVIGEGTEVVTINVGEATYKGVTKLLEAAPKSSDEIKETIKSK